jgi:pimeloyl-ACP methyl ester carboxylesterase
MRFLFLNVPRGIVLLVGSALLLSAPCFLFAQDSITNVISPVVSYQYYDSVTEDTNSLIISLHVSYQFYNSLTDMDTNSVIVSPIASYQYFDWPGTADLQLVNSPSVSYFFDTLGQGSISLTTQGAVTDSTGTPIANATITASIFSVSAATAQSGLDGTYIMPALAPGTYQFAAATVGYVADRRVVLLSSATAQQNFRLMPLPALQVQTAGSTPPISTPSDDIQGATLRVFDGSAFQTGLALDPTKMTIVLTHGWVQCLSPGFPPWPTDMALAMKATGVLTIANIVAWDWHQAANTCLSIPWGKTYDQGTNLGCALYQALGPGYSKPLHFIGHSLGTMVNAEAANFLTGHPAGSEPIADTAWNAQNIHLTMFDEAEIAADEGQLLLTALDSGFVNGAGAASWEPDYCPPIPRSWQDYAWIDNYISAFGMVHAEAVNVYLPEAANLFCPIDLFDSAQNMHGYPMIWYQATVANTAGNEMGFINTFESSELPGGPAFPPKANEFTPGYGFYQDNPNSPLEVMSEPAPPSNWNAPFLPLAAPTGFQHAFVGVEVETSVITAIGQASLNTLGNVTVTVAQDTSVGVDDAFNYVASQTSQATVDLVNQPQLQFNLLTESLIAIGLNRSRPLTPIPDGGTNSANVEPSVWMTVSIPANASDLMFTFTASGECAQDSIVFGINNTTLLSLGLAFLTSGQTYSSGPIDIAAYAGTSTNQLFFGVVGGTSTNANVQIGNIQFISFTAPSLSIAQSNGEMFLSWPSSANGFTLQSATDLNQGDWAAVTNVPALFGGYFSVTNNWPDQTRFFRLLSQ